ncbi:MFS transporter [Microlunatus sp. GCM10028923]|uniref:MFS transporter n=1 Tax=Microlunatus sp. GCM10028923 TaxID=3273400 RepID=UPI003622244E
MNPPRATARTWWGLAALLLPALLTSMDVSILFLAGPTLAESLRMSPTQWLWTMDIYGLVMAGLLITMGNLGDRFGRRRLLIIGAAIFGAASLLLALAPNAETLILGRGILAVGGATLAPSTLSLIRDMFTDAHQRRLALGAWTIAFTGGAVGGPIIGGQLLEHLWWGSVFLINAPAMLLLLILVPLLVPESTPRRGTRVDVAGALSSLVAIISLSALLKTLIGPTLGIATLITFVVALGAGWYFLARQGRSPDPLINPQWFRERSFSAGIGANAMIAAITGGIGVLVFPYLQTVHGLSPFWAALCGLPPMIGSMLGATAATRLARHRPIAPLIVTGLLVAAAGTALLAFTATHGSLVGFLAGYTVLIFGCSGIAPLANSLVLAHPPPDRVGAAAGISESSNQLGTSLGIVSFGTLATLVYRHDLRDALGTESSGAERSLADAVNLARALPEQQAQALLDQASTAYSSGLTVATLVAGALLALVAAAWIGWRRRRA